jgi:two-component system, NarL family, sensor histidine kinase DesK
LVAGWLGGLGWIDLLQTIVFITAIIFITRSVMWSIMTSWELHDARREIARLAVTTERLRIARDLHDLLGHNLSLIALKSELAGRLIKVSPERAVVEIGDVENVARTTLQEVREAVARYRQPTLENELHVAREILTAAGIAYRYEGDENVTGGLPTAIEVALSWVVRESVTNVIRHSRARQCIISVTKDTKNVSVEIADDGVAVVGSAHNQGNGLRGLAERVIALGGHCETGPRSSGGFRVAVSVPLSQRNHLTETTDIADAPRIPQATMLASGSEERSKQA